MECESLKDVREQVDALDPNIEYPERVVHQPRGRSLCEEGAFAIWLARFATTTHEERERLFGDDPMDASY